MIIKIKPDNEIFHAKSKETKIQITGNEIKATMLII